MKRLISQVLACSLVLLASISAANAQNKCVIPIPPATRIRMNATDPGAAQQLQWYAQGVTAMKARDTTPTDPTSWSYQAAIHGTYRSPAQPLWNTCQHGTYFFLAWHRIYIYFFERIVRASSNPSFDLPYWDYDNPTSPTDSKLQLPPQFRDTSSPLFVSQRSTTMNAGGYLPVGDVVSDYSMKRVQFTCGSTNWDSSFSGQQVASPIHFNAGFGALESLPHNAVHDDVGGWMGDPNTAAQDPIFWLHHGNIDRLWDAWIKLDQSRQDTQDPNWLDTKFYFFDENKQQCYLTAADILDDAAKLGYKYQDASVPAPTQTVSCPKPLAIAAVRALIAELVPVKKVVLGRQPITINIPVKPIPPPSGPGPLSEAAKMAALPRRVVLSIEQINFDKNPGVGYEIYINLPEGEKPSYKSPHYAGTLHFFGLYHVKADAKRSQVQFDISRVAAYLMEKQQWAQQLRITYVPRGPLGEKKEAATSKSVSFGTASFGKITITAVE
jgi:tyrosinase